MSTNDAQAQALIDALAPKIAEAILPKIAESVEGQIKGIKDKNQELLDKLANAKQEPDLSKLLEAAEKQIAARLSGGTLDSSPKPRVISKEDARDPAKYRAAKKQAADAGVPLQIEGR